MTNEIGKDLDSNVLYLDYNATTPLDPEVRKAIKRSIDEDWANPSSGKYVFAILQKIYSINFIKLNSLLFINYLQR